MTKFTDFSLDPRILRGVDNAGFVHPTPIQTQAIPQVIQGRDVLGLAQTGTGKTAAFVLPMLQHLTQGPLGRVRALIVAPTRELAEQIHETIQTLGKFTKIRSVTIYGGVGKGAQLAALRQGAEIVVACPGRLLDHLGEKEIDLSGVEILVLDEADRMCDMGFLPDVRRILNHLPRQRQTLFFSATMPEEIRDLSNAILKSPVTVQVDMIAPAKTVSHALYPLQSQKQKESMLHSFLEQTPTGRVLIFTRTKYRARSVAQRLEKKGYRVAALQGNMSQNRRQEAMNGFRDGKYDIMVATDIAARGIDVEQISHVINFDIPDTVDAYTHRIGRTGRAKQEGEALTFILPEDEPMVRDIERLLGSRIERRQLAGFTYQSANDSSPDPLERPPREHSPRPSTRRNQPARSSRDERGHAPQTKEASPQQAQQKSQSGEAKRRRFRRRPAKHGGQQG